MAWKPARIGFQAIRVNFAKSALSLSQRILFLETAIDSSPNEGCGHARTCTGHSAARGFIQTLSPLPPQSVSEDAGHHGFSVFDTSVRPASHAAPLVLAETSNSSTRLASRTPPHHGEPGLRCSSGPLEGLSVDGMVLVPWHGLQKEGGLERCLQLWLGGTVQRQTGLWPLVEARLPSHQLLVNAGSMVGPSHYSARPEGTSLLSPYGQYDSMTT